LFSKLQQYTYGLILVYLLGTILHKGKDLLIPFVLAVAIWYLMNLLAHALQSVIGRFRIAPFWSTLVVAIMLVLVLDLLVIRILSSNFAEISKAIPGYQNKINEIIARFYKWMRWDGDPTISALLSSLDMKSFASTVASTATGLLSNVTIILVYLLFLFLEQSSFQMKLKALLPDKERYDEISTLFNHISHDIRKYLGLKAAISFITAVLSYIVMLAFGLDFASFWAILIFFFNFIPTIGSVIATLFPATIALIQFSHAPWWMVLMVGLLISIQLFIGNFLEPRWMGNSLNLSPIVILLSLALWGTLWGIVGMFLCVPIMAVLVIIFSHFPATKPLAILLSTRGHLKDV
jgi:predicted PurR-regulated permease PerM